MVEQAWRVVQPVLDHWAATKAQFPNYPSGSDGPAEADALLGRRKWRPVSPPPAK
jgi:glucose-6-phosphate 1-dehydrogenase